MKKPASIPRSPRSARPSMRFKLDGEWWTVRVGRPPDKEKLDGLCHYKKRTIYLNPTAVAGDLLGVVAHEVTHAVIAPTDESHVLDNERIICCVVRWAAKNFCGGKIPIGKHRTDR